MESIIEHLDPTLLCHFEASLDGILILPAHPDYDRRRALWNSKRDSRPAMIVQPANAEDVSKAVTFAVANDIEIAVRGAGHHVAGFAGGNKCLVIDMAHLRLLEIDDHAATVRVGAGLTWGELNAALAARGYATPGPKVASVGVAGSTLGGGIGWLARKYGLAIDNLLEAEIVTADGQIRIANFNNNHELFWALRGGGGNFGVVTQLTFAIHSLPAVVAGLIVFPLAEARMVLGRYLGFIQSTPAELTSSVALNALPDGTRVATIFVTWAGDIGQGIEFLSPLREFGTVLANTIAPTFHGDLQQQMAEMSPPGLARTWRSGFVRQADVALIERLVGHFSIAPSTFSSIHLDHLGGAINRVDPHATAYAHRTESINLSIEATWTDETVNGENDQWLEKCWDDVTAHLSGSSYVNFVDLGDRAAVERAYGTETRMWLKKVKLGYDPSNIFHRNHNIKQV